MEFLTDQDVYAATVRFLTGLGHDVATAAQLGLAQAEDAELLRVVQEQGRIFSPATGISVESSLSREVEREASTSACYLQPKMLCIWNSNGS